MVAAQGDKVTLVTLGPQGTCHERAVQRYLAFQGVDEYRIVLTTDLFAGLEMVREQPNTFLVQCSAHPKVHEITEKYWTEVFVVDTFIYPTKHLVVLSRREVEKPRSIGIVPATKGYVDLSQWEEVIDVVSKPVVGEGLLRGDYDSGLTHMEHVEDHADELRLDLDIGEIDTTWVVYGSEKRFKGEVIGIPSPQLFAHALGSRPPSSSFSTAAMKSAAPST
ncbi:MAG TPA: hypothetical protein VHU14_07490 [Solirubrobacterales bacterium]|nr:hypothetical protein [Solirubrobacterales bacterium]